MNVLCVCTAGKDRSPATARWLSRQYWPEHLFFAAGISRYRTRHYGTCHVSESTGVDMFITVGPIHYGYIQALQDLRGTRKPVVVIEELRKATLEDVPEIMEKHRRSIEKALRKVRGPK